ncbi:MAG: HlyD family efflux transporter periplasmic adaptor subunit [Pseudomonadota bacterium]
MSRIVRNRLLLWAPIALILVAGLAFLLRPQPVQVDIGTIDRGLVQVTVDEEGRARVRDVYVVSTPVAGRVRRIEAEVGDLVQGGKTVIAEIEPSDPEFLDVRTRRQVESEITAAKARQSLAEAEIDRVEAELAFAQGELRRAHHLVVNNTVSAALVERRETEVRSFEALLVEARAKLEVSKAELAAARSQLIEPSDVIAGTVPPRACCVPISAPVDGRVLKVVQESTAVVGAGATLIEIGDPRDLEIVVDVLSRDAVRITEGDGVLIEDWGGDATINGIVTRIEPTAFTEVSALGIEEQRVNIRVDLTDPPDRWQALGHGFRVEARIVVWRADDVPRVPLAALFRQGSAWAVFAVEDETARLRLIEIARQDDFYAAIAAGLEVGEQVVLYPDERIEDGTSIQERDTS